MLDDQLVKIVNYLKIDLLKTLKRIRNIGK